MINYVNLDHTHTSSYKENKKPCLKNHPCNGYVPSINYNDISACESSTLNIINDIDTKNFLRKSNYLSEFKTEDEKELARKNLGITNIGGNGCECNMDDYYTKEEIDALIDKYHYTAPEKISANFSVKAYRNDSEVYPIYKGMLIDKLIYTWTINNYKDQISEIKFENLNIVSYYSQGSGTLSREKNFTNPLISNKTETTTILSNYTDKKGNNPQPFTGSASIIFKDEILYLSNPNLNITNINNPQSVGDQSNFQVSLGDSATYLYLIIPQSKNISYIHIYEPHASDPGGDVTELLGLMSYLKYDDAIEYNIYKSRLKLTGNWEIKIG